MAIMDTQGAYFGLNNIYNMNHFMKLTKKNGFDLYGYMQKTAIRF